MELVAIGGTSVKESLKRSAKELPPLTAQWLDRTFAMAFKRVREEHAAAFKTCNRPHTAKVMTLASLVKPNFNRAYKRPNKKQKVSAS